MRTKPKIEIDLAKVEALASRLLTKEQIAISLGISDDTLYLRQRENKDFQEAIKRGREKGVAAVANKLVESANKGNTTAQIFILKTHGGQEWREQKDVNLTASQPVSIKIVDDLE
jgi:predicted transcriptional regulator